MDRLSEPIDKLISDTAADHRYDVLVVGSGYGGAVAALRFAEKGFKVCVFERGREYQPGDFPVGIAEAPGHFRVDTGREAEPAGREDALFDVRLGEETVVLVANALGGGSQINANVAMEPEGWVFQQEAWPAAIANRDHPLKEHFEKARDVLGAKQFQKFMERTRDGPVETDLDKTIRLRELASERSGGNPSSSADTHSIELARETLITVNFSGKPITLVDLPHGSCVGCGNCISGCNYGAKLTLTTSYLPRAHAAGAHFFTGATVIRVSRNGHQWRVVYVKTAELASYRRAVSRLKTSGTSGEKAKPLTDLKSRLEREIVVPTVVLSAGTLGSTEILKRSRREGLKLSDTLGERFSGNGDYLSFRYWQDEKVNAVGWDADNTTPDGLRDPEKGELVGPTITAIVHFNEKDDPTKSFNDRTKNFIVEDAAVPGALGYFFHELVTTAGTLGQLGEREFKTRGKNGAVRDPIGLSREGSENTQVFLTMGHDASGGKIDLGDTDRVRVVWPTLEADSHFEIYDEKLKPLSRLGGIYLGNPLWRPLPSSVDSLLSGARMRGRNFIVHPLGGCAMADNAATGVVNHFGAVFNLRKNADGHRAPPNGSNADTHRGLYVLDGSIIPTSLGANPFLTITALAERAMPYIIEREQPRRTQSQAVASSPVPTTRSAPPPEAAASSGSPVPATNKIAKATEKGSSPNEIGLQLSEVLRGPLASTKDFDACGGRTNLAIAAALKVYLPTDRITRFLQDPAHAFHDARADLQLSHVGSVGQALCTAHYRCDRGTVTILEPEPRTAMQRRLDTAQVVITWLLERGLREILERIGKWLQHTFRRLLHALHLGKAPGKLPTKMTAMIANGLTLARHAADRRQMAYDLTFKKLDRIATCALPSMVRVVGTKKIHYAADWLSIAKYLYGCIARWKGRPWLVRRNLWCSMAELDVELSEPGAGGRRIASGRLALAPVEMLNESDGMPRLTRGDTSLGLLSVFGYPALFVRYLIKSRLWDFRLPDYDPAPEIPYERKETGAALKVFHEQRLPVLAMDPRVALGTRPIEAPDAKVPLTSRMGGFVWFGSEGRGTPDNRVKVEPRAYHFKVPRHADSDDLISLVLWRYRQTFVTAQRTKDGATQFKSILLLHAFGQSAISFAEPTLTTNLVQHLYNNGWDVWLLEHRISVGLEASADACTIDEIADHDIAEAVNFCLDKLVEENFEGNPPKTPQLYALAQCVGSAALGMALLGGKLTHRKELPLPAENSGHELRRPPMVSKLAGVVFSQFTPHVIGQNGSQFRTFLPTLLRDVFGLKTVEFAAPAYENRNVTGTLIDRLLNTLPIDPDERCPGERQGVARTQVQASCRRMAGLEAPLFAHKHLARDTHDRLPHLLRRANLGVFVHARKCIEHERLVDPDGLNVYLTLENVQRHAHMPIAFLHGRENKLFSVGSSRKSYALFGQAFGRRHADDRIRLIVLPDYGHLDWLIGKNAFKDTYPRVTDFLDEAWKTNIEKSVVAPGAAETEDPTSVAFELRLPLCGPLIGWTRKEGGNLAAQVWVQPDNTGATPASCVVCRYESRTRGSILQCFDVQSGTDPSPASTRGATTPAAAPSEADQSNAIHFTCAVGTLLIPLDELPEDGAPVTIDVYSVHRRAREDSGSGWTDQVVIPLQREAVELDGATTRAAQTETPHQEESAAELWTSLFNRYPKRFDKAVNKLKDAIDKNTALAHRTIRSVLSQSILRPRSILDAQIAVSTAWAPTAENIRFIATCCRYPGFVIEKHRVDASFERISKRHLTGPTGSQACALFLVGDQIYADATAGIFDITSPVEKFTERYHELFAAAPFRKLVSRVPTYMCIDDHEIAEGWDGGTQALDAKLLRVARDAACTYQWSHSQAAAQRRPRSARCPPEFSHQMTLGEAVPVFLLDTRSERNRCAKPPTTLGAEQMARLKAWLEQADKAVPKIVVSGSPIAPGFQEYLSSPDRGRRSATDADDSQTLDNTRAIATGSKGNPSTYWDRYLAANADNWQAFENERADLLDFIYEKSIKNVVLLSGDYHCAAIARICRKERRIATAIIVPPAYAPLAYANTKASEIAPVEVFRDYEIRLETSNGKDRGVAAIDGSGYAEIALRQENGSWVLTTRFHVYDVCGGVNAGDEANWLTPSYEVDLGGG